MKRVLLALTAALLLACQMSPEKMKTESVKFADTTKFASLTIGVEFPLPQTEAMRSIRAVLVSVMDESLSGIGRFEGGRAFPAYRGNLDDTPAMMAYYESQALRQLDRASGVDAAERLSDGVSYMPSWEFDCKIVKGWENERCVVFEANNYSYAGGAHGGVYGAGSLVFDKRDGHRIVNLLLPACTEKMQPLLKKGLIQYFSDNGEKVSAEELRDWLFLEPGQPIPLPAWTPAPAEDGLVFTYQQYEIAAYACGMPSFIVPYKDIAPFLTEEAKEIVL
ncbi:MAG: DUF3298 domain-containing protein [Bacteroidales bacterium]|nr:DUF3298 domain-containing protein [Bacteroidales bacterium]